MRSVHVASYLVPAASNLVRLARLTALATAARNACAACDRLRHSNPTRRLPSSFELTRLGAHRRYTFAETCEGIFRRTEELSGWKHRQFTFLTAVRKEAETHRSSSKYRSRHRCTGVARIRSMYSSRVSGQLAGGQFGPGGTGSVYASMQQNCARNRISRPPPALGIWKSHRAYRRTMAASRSTCRHQIKPTTPPR
jgi:hypothetical protein